MPCRSERRSAAAPLALAVALALTLLSTRPPGALSQPQPPGLVPPPPPPHHNPTCDDVPSPFGVRGRSLPGFEVACGPNREAMLPIGDRSYRINAVSVPGSYVVIFAGPVKQVCFGRRGRPTERAATGPTSLERTPFTFSKRNKLVNVGCNIMLLASFTNPPGGEPSRWSYSFGCSTSCNGSSVDANISGACLGEACCAFDMPDLVNGVRSFTVSFGRTMEVTDEEDGTCSAAFFLSKHEHVFTGGGAEGGRTLKLKEALVSPRERRMILDWAIGNGTSCDQAQNYNSATPYCSNMSACVDAPSGAGYLCKCRSGYRGNPYEPDGCEDINECWDPNSNDCTFQKFCNNTPGSFTCSCPQNMTGDGHRTGTGCNATLVPSGRPPKQQSQGSSVCDRPEGRGCQKHFPLEIALGVGLALVVTIATAVSCYCWAMKKREVGTKRAELFRKNGGLLLQQKFSVITSQGEGLSAKIFSAEELETATNNYNESRILGRGGQGTVYKGILPDKTVVAIKKSKVFDESHVHQFVNEITILSQIDHPNVVKFFGCCLETQVPLLVYEFIPNGTLFQQIHNRNEPRPLTWEECLRIAAEVAEALAHLHSTSPIPIIHRDIKSSNILLDENFVAKISDFGVSRSVPFDQTHITTLIQGTIGYLDPEYLQSGQLTQKSDVYSFGVVLAELLTRQKPISVARPEDSCNLAMYLVVLCNEGRLLEEIEPHILAEAGEEQLHAVAELSVRCLNVKGEERPAMAEVASILDGLKRSLTMEQTNGETDELTQKVNEQGEEHLVREIRAISSLHSSEISTQCSMEAEMLSSSHMPR
ncbi:hypothetical protein ACP70R_010242 [Stipagrostis hirtigluma subsp. patula]